MTGFFRFARRAALAMAMLAGGAMMTFEEASARAGHGGGRSGGHVSRGFSGHRGFAAPRAAFRPMGIARPYHAPRQQYRRVYRPPANYGGRRHVRRGYYAAPFYLGAGYAGSYGAGGYYDQYGRWCVPKKRWQATPWGWRWVNRPVCYWPQ